MYKRSDLSRFVKGYAISRLDAGYLEFTKGDIFRPRANLLQILILWVSRGGWIHIEPTLYVVGANPSEQTLHQTVSLGGKEPRSWQFSPETPLDAEFADLIVNQLNQDSPISFTQPLTDEAIDKGLRWFGKDGLHWAADLFLAFFNMTRGAPTARKDLAHAFELFRRNSRMVTDKPLRDWEKALLVRFKELESRLDRPDGIALCRADAEAHAKQLKLPSIVWPPEWPESVPPWPKDSAGSWIKRFIG